MNHLLNPRYFLAASMLGAALILAVCGYQLKIYEDELEAITLAREHSKLETAVTILEHAGHQASDDFELIRNQLVRLTARQAASKENANADVFLKQARALFLDAIGDGRNEHILQLRLINPEGIESLRVERIDGEPHLVDNNQLQNKRSRDYVREGLALAPGAVLLTTAELNREHGEVVDPPQPVTRFVTRIDNVPGGDFVLLVMNVDISSWLAPVLRATASANGVETVVIDWAGHIIAGGERFGRYAFGEDSRGASSRFEDALPSLVPAIADQTHGVVELDDGFYSFEHYLPLSAGDPAFLEDQRRALVVQYIPYDSIMVGGLYRTTPIMLFAAVLLLFYVVMLRALWVALKRNRQLIDERTRRDNTFAVISHELRTPIASIRMLAEGDEDSWRESGETIRSLSAHLVNLMDDLRQVISPDARRPVRSEDFLPADAISAALSQCSAVISRQGCKVSVYIAPSAARRVNADRFRLVSAVSNLVRNACLHSGGSECWVSAQLREEGGHLLLAVAVEDDGRGIPAAKVEELFRPFSRGQTSREGMGLGLHIARAWINEVGGHVSYFSSEHGGAGMQIRMPVIESQLVTVGPAVDEHDTLEARLNGLRVLLVEDDAILRRITGKLLKSVFGGLDVREDGHEGLKAINESHFDLVLTDYFMPNMDGREMIRSLRELRNMIPVIAVTAATIGQEQEQLLEAGADIVLSKPLERRTLLEACEKLVESGRLSLAAAKRNG